MIPVPFFDCNVSFGAPAAGGYATCHTLCDLVKELDWAGVGQALVWHTLMREQSPVVGNAVLAAELANWRATAACSERITGTWAILPPQTGELPMDDSFFDQMKEHGVQALWAFPEEHRYVLSRLTFGTFLDRVSEHRVPLFVPRNAGGPRPPDTWEMLASLLGEYPRLRVVLAHHGPWGEDRFFRPLLERYSGLYLDISRYELDCGLRDLVSRYGAGSLLYGSHFPETAMGGPLLLLARSEIGEDDRAAIAGGNLRRLMTEVQL